MEVGKKEIKNPESDILDSGNPMFSNKEHPMFWFPNQQFSICDILDSKNCMVTFSVKLTCVGMY